VPVDCEIDHASRFVRVSAHGVVLLQEILDYFDTLVVQDAMSYPKLFDARRAEPRLSDDDMMILGAFVSAYGAFDPRGPVGAVATSTPAVSIIRRFMNLSAPDRPMRLFSSIEAALDWLGATHPVARPATVGGQLPLVD
jgi:hypothetical protein